MTVQQYITKSNTNQVATQRTNPEQANLKSHKVLHYTITVLGIRRNAGRASLPPRWPMRLWSINLTRITPTMHRSGNNLNFTTPTNSPFIPLPSMLKIGETLLRLSVILVFWCRPSHFQANPCSWVLDSIIIPYQSSSRFPSNLMTSYLMMLVSFADVWNAWVLSVSQAILLPSAVLKKNQVYQISIGSRLLEWSVFRPAIIILETIVFLEWSRLNWHVSLFACQGQSVLNKVAHSSPQWPDYVRLKYLL